MSNGQIQICPMNQFNAVISPKVYKFVVVFLSLTRYNSISLFRERNKRYAMINYINSRLMSITLVNVCSNSVECWGGIQTLRRRVNTIIIMLYTALSVGKHTPLQS